MGLSNMPKKYTSNKGFLQINVSWTHSSIKTGDAYLRKYGIYWYKNALIFYMEYLHTI